MPPEKTAFGRVSFVPPKGWVDRTMVSYVAAPEQKGASFSLTRDALDPHGEGTTLRTYVDRQLVDLATRLHAFELLENDERDVRGVKAPFVRFSWVSHYGELEQTITYLECAAPEGPFVLALVTTTPRTEAETTRGVFAELLETLRVEDARP